MKKFTLGVATGFASLAVAVPILASMTSAQSSGSPSSTGNGPDADRPVPTQACLQAMVMLADAHLANFDAMSADHKTMMQERRDELAAIAAIGDDTARKEALQQQRDEMRAAMEADKPEPPEAITAAMDAVKEACGDTFSGGHKFMMKMGGPGHMGFGGPMGMRTMH